MGFFPIGDDNSDRARVPYFTMLLVAINALVFLLELSVNGQGPNALEAFVRHWAVIPADYTRGAGLGGPVPTTLLTAMFLHGGWAHLMGNMLYLWIFGDNVEDVMGKARFLIFYLLCGVAAAFAQILVSPHSDIPSLGASGAISGVLAAYLALFPRRRVRVLLLRTIAYMPAIAVIGFWFLLQLFSGIGQVTQTEETGGVAYAAHVGGFVAGFLLVWLFRSRRRSYAA